MRNNVINDNYINNGLNIKLAQNGLSRCHFNKRLSINATRVQMKDKRNYMCKLMFSCKFKHYTMKP